MSLTNPLGDFEVTDPKTMRALAHPTRLAIMSWLHRHGTATATQLSPHVGATPSVTSWHLRHLAGFGLVRDAEGGTDGRQRLWEATATGFRFDAPADPDDTEGQAAYRALAGELMATTHEVPRQWFATIEPELEADWRIESGVMNTRIEVTLDELRDIGHKFEEILAAYVHRDTGDDDAGERRGVRFLRYVMPEPAEPTDEESA
jgi:DNA-binding transcriptional ArsR family regulator